MGKSSSSRRASPDTKRSPAPIKSDVGGACEGKPADAGAAVRSLGKNSIKPEPAPTKEAAEPIRRRKLYEEVVARLEARILAGKLLPGDPLPSERELMRYFGVGRPAIREACLLCIEWGW